MMRRSISVISVVAALVIMSTAALAGDVPEALLDQQGARVFIGTVDSFTLENDGNSPQAIVETANVTPSVKIKGDVEIGVTSTYTHCDFGGLVPQRGREYLFGYIDENNFYIYEIKERDGETIRLADADKFDMVERLENYLNEGAFAMAEQERSSIGTQITFAQFLQDKALSDAQVDRVTFWSKDAVYEIDKDEFAQVAESIYVTNVENAAIRKTGEENGYDSVLYITLQDAQGKGIAFAAVTEYGEVDRYSLSFSRLMMADYQMQTRDLARLYELIPDEPRAPVGAIAACAGAAAVIAIAIIIWHMTRRKRLK